MAKAVFKCIAPEAKARAGGLFPYFGKCNCYGFKDLE